MFYAGTGKILMRYTNVRKSTADFTGGFITLTRRENNVTEFLVDNLSGKKEFFGQKEAFKKSPALHQTMIDIFVERYKGAGGKKEAFKRDFMFGLVKNLR